MMTLILHLLNFYSHLFFLIGGGLYDEHTVNQINNFPFKIGEGAYTPEYTVLAFKSSEASLKVP